MPEIAPKAMRGTVVVGYSFAVTVGLLLASCVGSAIENRFDSDSCRIPIAIQFLWAIILGGGLLFLPESPRWYVKNGKLDKAGTALRKLRGQPQDSQYIRDELNELIANYEYEANNTSGSRPKGGWAPSGNLRRVAAGVAMQTFQQWTGVNFIF